MRFFMILAATTAFCGAIVAAALAGPSLSDAMVRIDNFSFGPTQITVARGTKVVWSNQDDIPHTVMAEANPKDFKSPALDTGEVFSHVFTSAGTFRYFCSIHPKMQGVIVVK